LAQRDPLDAQDLGFVRSSLMLGFSMVSASPRSHLLRARFKA